MFLIFRSFDEFRRRLETIPLSAEEVRHVRARRLNPGDWLFVADGTGLGCPALLGQQSLHRWICTPDYERLERQSSRERLVFASLPKGNRIDLIGEKGTELGMTRFGPVEFERSVRDSFSPERLARIAGQAAAQSGRFRLPVFDDPIGFEELLDRISPAHPAGETGIRFLLLDRNGENPATLIGDSKPISESTGNPAPAALPFAIIAGPEGGLTREEFVSLREAGALPIRISDGILRIETAVVSGLSLIQLLQGNPTL